MSEDNRKGLGKVYGYCFYFVIIQKRATFLDFFYFCGQFVINETVAIAGDFGKVQRPLKPSLLGSDAM